MCDKLHYLICHNFRFMDHNYMKNNINNNLIYRSLCKIGKFVLDLSTSLVVRGAQTWSAAIE